MLQTMIRLFQEIEQVFVRVTTSVVFVAAVYICIFWGKDCEVGIELLWQILGTSLLCAVGYGILFINQDCSKWAMFVKRVIYLLFVNVIVLGAGYVFEWFYLSNWKMIALMEVCIVAVFIVVTIISYLADYKVAEKMNQRLRERNQGIHE